MNTEGTITFTDGSGRERRVACSGGLDSYRDRDGGLRVQGVLNLDGADAEALRAVMESQAQAADESRVRYRGQVRTEDGSATETVDDVPLRVEAVTGDGSVRVDSGRTDGG